MFVVLMASVGVCSDALVPLVSVVPLVSFGGS